MVKAYSYLRFSTPEQAQGDSFRRQTALALKYAQQHGLDLDTSLNFHDLGVSAYHGKNASAEGRLGAFIDAIKQELVPQGSYLLVESLDRLSRETARTAFRKLEDVVDAGAVVVTLLDGRKYDKGSLNNDPTALLLSILTFMRAHEESATKATRIKAAWSEKRENAVKHGKPMTGACPAWLSLDQSTGKFNLIPERAELVQRIFRMTLEGIGQHSIAQTLNREGVPPFGRAVHWHRTYISKILDSPAVLGVFIPHIQEHGTGKLVRHALDPIQGYFPAIIEPEIAQRLQSMRAGTVQPRRGRHAAVPLSNLFGGLGKCFICGSTMTLSNKGEGNRYLVCTRAKAGAGCQYKAIPYQGIEDAFLAACPELLAQAPDVSAEQSRIRQNLAVYAEHKAWLDETIQNIVQAIEGQASMPATLLERLAELESERTQVLQEEARELLKEQSIAGNVFTHRLDAVRALLQEQPLDKAKVNAVLRQLFSAVQIDSKADELVLRWQHSTKHFNRVRYTGPKEGRVQAAVADPVIPPIPPSPYAPSLLPLPSVPAVLPAPRVRARRSSASLTVVPRKP